MTVKCDLCKEFGLTFKSTTINPEEYIEGNINAKVWIIGLNPRYDIERIESRTKKEFHEFNPNTDVDRSKSKYFLKFQKVSAKLYSNWISPKNTVAHTDLVKCFFPTFPPKINSKNVDIEPIIRNCKKHLLSQIRKHKPKVIICNGTKVCREIISFFPPSNNLEPSNLLTSYRTKLSYDDTDEFWIILSGFIGRIDDRNKRRLGKEIEKIFEDADIKL